MRALTLLFGLLLGTRTVLGCQCGSKPTPTEAMSRSVAVFDGTVVRRNPVLARIESDTTVVDEYAFLVHHVWLGPGDSQRVLQQGFTNCDSGFAVGSRYLVFAEDRRGTVTPVSSVCLPTQLLERATSALAELGPGYPVSPVRAAPPESSRRATLRHAKASFLTSAMLLREIVSSPREALHTLWPYLLANLLGLALLISVLAYTVVRRRPVLLLTWVMPVLALLAALFVLEGYLFLRARPLWWHVIDYIPGGV